MCERESTVCTSPLKQVASEHTKSARRRDHLIPKRFRRQKQVIKRYKLHKRVCETVEWEQYKEHGGGERKATKEVYAEHLLSTRAVTTQCYRSSDHQLHLINITKEVKSTRGEHVISQA